MGRGIHSRIIAELERPWGEASTCTACGKCVQACPTGAMAEKGRAVEEMVKRANPVSVAAGRSKGVSA
jgi:bidirectional [NiFe] hydrogenase diaphorase subunit